MPVVATAAVRIQMLRRRGRYLVGVFLATRDSGAAIGALCERALTVVGEFSGILALDLRQAAMSTPGLDGEWLRRQYMTLLGDFAVSIRDLIPDRDARHGLAQAMQCAILQHERRLREVTALAVQK